MIYKNTKKGFTLIELLVVVLIIAILAAIALPKYETTVQVSKLKRAMPLMRSLFDAQQRQKLATGSYTADPDALDVSSPCSSYKLYSAGVTYCYIDGIPGVIVIQASGIVKYQPGFGNTLMLVPPNQWSCLSYAKDGYFGYNKDFPDSVCKAAGFTKYSSDFDSGTGINGAWFMDN